MRSETLFWLLLSFVFALVYSGALARVGRGTLTDWMLSLTVAALCVALIPNSKEKQSHWSDNLKGLADENVS